MLGHVLFVVACSVLFMGLLDCMRFIFFIVFMFVILMSFFSALNTVLSMFSACLFIDFHSF